MTDAAQTARPGRRIVLWGTCDTGKPRVRILRDGLHANGIEVIECRVDIWNDIHDKSHVKSVKRWLRLFVRIACAYPRLIWRYLRLPRHDWVLLGYPAIPDVFVIRLFAWLRGSRIAMDCATSVPPMSASASSATPIQAAARIWICILGQPGRSFKKKGACRRFRIIASSAMSRRGASGARARRTTDRGSGHPAWLRHGSRTRFSRAMRRG